MRKELQHALTQESSICHDQLQQALRQQVCQEKYADAESTRETNQPRHLIAEQAEATQRMNLVPSSLFLSSKRSVLTSSMLSSSSLTMFSETRMR